jgi:dihydroflavonol-4-reductase
MKVFLTGATGFVGHHVARELQAQGAELYLLVRQSSRLDNLEGVEGERIVGDLKDPELLLPVLKDCEALIHVAAEYKLWVRDPEAMYHTNVDGTRSMLRVAREAGIRRVVYTSSVATMGFREDGSIVDEDTPVSLSDMVGHYKRSKFMAEFEALKAADAGQNIVILNPTTPIGPHDVKPTPTGRIVVDFLNHKFPAYMDTGLNLVDVREVARMHVSALEKGKSGERYILGGENLTLKQILDKMSTITGIPSPKMKIPSFIALAYAYYEEKVTAGMRGKEPRATMEEVQMAKKKMFATSAKAELALGFQVIPVYQALRAAIHWFQTNGYAPSPAQ